MSLARRLAGARRAIVRRLRHGGDAEKRSRRYLLAGAIGCFGVWTMSAGYLALMPPTFTSGFVLVMPGTGAGSSVNLPTLGQATSTSSSPFASPELSPTENYRKMLLSRRLLTAAAKAADENPDAFPAPRIDLADQTKLIAVKVTGRTAGQAAGRAEALRTSFLAMLDALRNDEIQMRDVAFRNQLAGYKVAVEQARQRLTAHEAETGLVSLEQYSVIVASVERSREALRDVDTRLANTRAGVAELTRQLGVTPEQAAAAMALRSDPLFQSLLEQLAKQETEMATLTGTHGPANPRVADLTAERAGVVAKLTARAAEVTGIRRNDILKLRDLSTREERARLFERIVGQTADAESLAATRAKLIEQIEAEQVRVSRLAPAASHLDDLRRDLQVAEAVFSSALARTDTSKSDYFASYPMVQTLEDPEVPSRKSGPLPSFALAGGFAATLLIIASLVLTWIRTALLQRILKSA